MAERKMKSKKTWEKDEEIEISNNNGIEEEDVSPSLEDVEFEEIVEEAKEKLGVVNCARLNVRVSPSLTALVVCILDNGSKVSIIDDSDPDFYKVYTETGAYGFCMKQFINVE